MASTTKKANLILWGAGTIRTLRPLWMLHELELNYDLHPIGSRTGETQMPEFQALNPRGKIPVLQDGNLTLVESAAIITYLAETYGAKTGFVPPAGSPERALYNQWCFFVMTELDAHAIYIIRRHEDLASIYGASPVAIQAAREYFAFHVNVASQELQARGPYLLGDTLTCADILLTTCLVAAKSYRLAISEVLTDYLQRLTSREAYQKAQDINKPPK